MKSIKERGTYILLQLIFIGCMFPPLPKCWDAYLIPKWYAGMASILVCSVIFSKKTIWNTAISEWISNLAKAAAIGIGLQTGYMLLSISHLTSRGFAGTFDAPAGLAVTICLAVATIAIHLKSDCSQRIPTLFYRIAILTGIALVILSKSRAGLLALCFESIIILLYSRIKFGAKIGIIAIISSCTLVVVLTSKKDSSIGRNFITKQTVNLIQKRPLTGYGHHGFRKTYMPMQQHYFETYRDADAAWLADDIKHPLNEFLLAWVNYGFLGTLLLMMAILLPIVVFRFHPLAWMISGILFIFCSFSYPLSYPIAWVYILAGIVTAIHKWGKFQINHTLKFISVGISLCILTTLPCDFMQSKAYKYSKRGEHNRALQTYKECQHLFDHFPFSLVYHFRAPQFLYNYTYELYIMGHLEEAQRISKKCLQYTDNYNLQLLMGDINQMQRCFKKSVTHYHNAHYMCPVRIAPLSGIIQVYQQIGDTLKADSIAQIILNKPIKIPSAEIDEMKAEAKKWIDGKANQ